MAAFGFRTPGAVFFICAVRAYVAFWARSEQRDIPPLAADVANTVTMIHMVSFNTKFSNMFHSFSPHILATPFFAIMVEYG